MIWKIIDVTFRIAGFILVLPLAIPLALLFVLSEGAETVCKEAISWARDWFTFDWSEA